MTCNLVDRARIGAIVMLLGGAAPAVAQSGATAPARNAPEIVVKAQTEQKSEWKRADADHVVVFSKGSEHELRRITRNLETLHLLMSRLYRPNDKTDDALRLQVTLLDSGSRLRALGLTPLRAQEGPFPQNFSAAHYYDPDEDGEVLAIARDDQLIDLDTTRRFNLDCDDYHADDGQELCGVVHHLAIRRSWEATLHAAFAQRFLLTYAPAPYPRWYLDSIGALFSTIDPQQSGAIDYAGPPDRYREVFKSYGYPDAAAVLSGRYLDSPPAQTGWSPYGAWLLAHYFLFSNLKAERSQQFKAYMAAIGQGKPMAEAATVFGSMMQLQRDLIHYAESDLTVARAGAPQVAVADPLITTLSLSAGALVEAKIAPQAQLAAAGLPDDAETLLLVAETHCRGGRAGECLATAERVLARAPDNATALAWKGVALTDLAIAGAPAERSARLAEARKPIERAIALGGESPLALIAQFASYTKAGERVPDAAMRGMAMVIRAVPAAPAPRLYLAQELVRQGNPDLARRVLYPVLYGAYDSPEKKAAQALFAPRSADQSSSRARKADAAARAG